jgi:hypothetical protein
MRWGDSGCAEVLDKTDGRAKISNAKRSRAAISSMQTKLPINIQLRLCLNCGHPLMVPVSSRKVFCSPRCRNTFHHRLYRQRKRLNDPEWAARSLQRLKEWREAHGLDKSIKRKGGEATNE